MMWFLLAWFVVSCVVGPVAGRWLGRISDRYPEAPR